MDTPTTLYFGRHSHLTKWLPLFPSTLATSTKASFVFAASPSPRWRSLHLQLGCIPPPPKWAVLNLSPFSLSYNQSSVGTPLPPALVPKRWERKALLFQALLSMLLYPTKKQLYMLQILIYAHDSAGKKLVESVVEERLAACVNRVPGVESVYEWKGEIQTDSEELLIIKTRQSLLEALTEHVKANHEYEVPEVISLPITGGNLKYLEWIKDSTRD